MKFYILTLLFGILSCAVCRDVVRREDARYWYSSYTESSSGGSISITKVCDEGKYIELANWSEEKQYLNGWTIKQKVTGVPAVSYTFTYCAISPESKRKIVARNWMEEAHARDFVAIDAEKWATGRDIQTYLYNRNATLIAKHVQDRASSICRHIEREDGSYTVWSSSYVEMSSEGPFAITGTDPDGKYIELINLSNERQTLDGWTLKQKVNGLPGPSFTFMYCSLGPDQPRKIIARKWTNVKEEKDFVATYVDSWATGSEIKTYLYDKNSTLRAEYIRDSASSTNLLE